MTILVMYTKACIRMGVKRRERAPEVAPQPREEGEGSVAETNVSDQSWTAEELAAVSQGFESAPASAAIRWAVDSFGDSLVLAASFEDVVLIDLATKVAPAVEVVFLDTEAHFPETLAFVEDMGSVTPSTSR
jgi:3'-phosphoadenosine 5'-phosphosulfate sulfotransferase (PAPS reductase)/FAD synthetase